MASKWWVASAALLTLLAGCMDDAPGADSIDNKDPSQDPAQGDGNQTVDPNVTNSAPNATLEPSALNGTAPLNVTLTLGGSDPDGDNLTWTLTVGNDTRNGSALPATVNLTLEAGNHSVLLVVSDGNATGNASLVIAVEAGVPADPCAGQESPCVIEELPWADRYSDGTCHATGTVLEVPGAAAGTYYAHERGDPPGTGYAAGDGTWFYEETNGIPGLQVGGTESLSGLGGEQAVYADCANPDYLIF